MRSFLVLLLLASAAASAASASFGNGLAEDIDSSNDLAVEEEEFIVELEDAASVDMDRSQTCKIKKKGDCRYTSGETTF